MPRCNGGHQRGIKTARQQHAEGHIGHQPLHHCLNNYHKSMHCNWASQVLQEQCHILAPEAHRIWTLMNLKDLYREGNSWWCFQYLLKGRAESKRIVGGWGDVGLGIPHRIVVSAKPSCNRCSIVINEYLRRETKQHDIGLNACQFYIYQVSTAKSTKKVWSVECEVSAIP